GYYHDRGNQGVLDDLYSKAIVLDDGVNRVAIVVCDLLAMPRHLVDESRKLAEAETGIPATHIMIGATHTHTAPVLTSGRNDDTGEAGTPEGKMYNLALPGLIAKSIAEANKNRVPVSFWVAKESEPQLAKNR